jgi:hypothetical protein
MPVPTPIIKLQGLDGILETLASLPAEVVSKNGGPVKAALRKGALVLLDEELLQLARVTSNATVEPYQHTGLLAKSVIASRGKAPSSGKGERYLVRIKRKAYTGRRGGKPVSTLKVAQLLEYGSATQNAEPWIRVAFQAKAVAAMDTITRELIIGVDRVVARLAAKNKGK